jgi:hypothetical protein
LALKKLFRPSVVDVGWQMVVVLVGEIFFFDQGVEGVGLQKKFFCPWGAVGQRFFSVETSMATSGGLASEKTFWSMGVEVG